MPNGIGLFARFTLHHRRMHPGFPEDDGTAIFTAVDARERASNRLEAWLVIALGIGGVTLMACEVWLR